MDAWRYAAPAIALAVLVVDGCSSVSAGNASPALDSNGGLPGNNTAGGGSSGGSSSRSSDGGMAALPPEVKVENKYKAPVATGNFVWSANPTSGRVAYIDAKTFDVQTAEAGNAPTYLAAVRDANHPTDDLAVVINVLSQDATLLRVDSTGRLSTQTYVSTVDANSWAISPTGRWGIAWTDATFVSNADPTEGFQSLAVMDFGNPATGSPPVPATILAVGYRPVEIAFTEDDSRAFAVTEDGISVVDLTGQEPIVIRQDPLSAEAAPPVGDASSPSGDAAPADAGEASAALPSGDASGANSSGDDSTNTADAGTPAAGAPDVSFTPDGAYALVRRDGLSVVTIDSLADGSLTTIPLPAAPTDLTISPLGDFAVAVLRDTSTVVVLPIPGVVGHPAAITTVPITGQLIGRALISADEKSVVLFTTVAPVDSITVLTLSPPATYRTVALHAAVQAVFPTADGKYAIVLHQPPATGSAVKGAFSVVPIAQELPAVIQSLPAAPTAVALSNDRAIVSISDGPSSTYGLYMVLMPSLEVRPYVLASPPIAVGIAAGAGRGYVAQDYSEGRITFVDLSEGVPPDGGGGFTARTITGFELSAGIVVGPDQ
jgi:hypothetical protein